MKIIEYIFCPFTFPNSATVYGIKIILYAPSIRKDIILNKIFLIFIYIQKKYASFISVIKERVEIINNSTIKIQKNTTLKEM
jgi:hypothetical protein